MGTDHHMRSADPSPADEPLDPAFLARVRARIQEQTVMNTIDTHRPHPAARRPRWQPALLIGGAAAVIALGVGIGINAGGDDGEPAASAPAVTQPPATQAPETTVPEKAPAVVDRPPGLEPAPVVEGGVAMMSCMPFDPTIFGEAPVGFDGVVTAVDGTKVTFEVSTWFRGGSGVVLETDGVYMSDDSAALIGNGPAVVGQRYLVAAELYSDAVRPGACGWVQPWSAEMAATYAGAFGA